MRFSLFQETRQGPRPSNQDKIGYLFTEAAILLVVCDGLGGHFRGEIGSHFVVEFMAKAFRQTATPRLADPEAFLRKGLLAANTALLRFAGQEGLPAVPRTTCAAAIIQDGRMTWAHAGDSRIYHIRSDEIIKQTKDHSRVQALIEAGAISERQAREHPERNKIHNCLGLSTPPIVEVSRSQSLRPGDVVLLTTDGLWSAVASSELARALTRHGPKDAIPWLLDLAETLGGQSGDNLSALALRTSIDPDDMLAPNAIVHPAEPDGPRMIEDSDLTISIEAIRASF